jgi:hypothetical protein
MCQPGETSTRGVQDIQVNRLNGLKSRAARGTFKNCKKKNIQQHV